jgi:N-acetylmuramoyl-L-alanine amidase
VSNRVKIIVSLVVFISFIGLLLLSDGFEIPKNIAVSEETGEYPIIVLDAGHGGRDPGAVMGDLLEKDINLSITNKTNDFLLLLGFDTVLTRKKDVALGEDKASDLKYRVKMANGYKDSLFISIHQNMFNISKYYGSQVFYGNCKGKDLATIIQGSIITRLQPENKRVVKDGKYLYVLEHTENSSVMIECGFMSNPQELKKLTDNSYQNSLSYVISTSVLEFILSENTI